MSKQNNEIPKSTQIIKSKFLYRLIQVITGIGIIFFVLAGISQSFQQYYPKQVLDKNKSKINCQNGKSYSFTEANISDYANKLSWLSDDIEKSKYICFKNESKPEDGYFLPFGAYEMKYTKTIAMKTEGSYEKFVLFSAIYIVILLFIIYIIRETILYLFFGKTLFKPVK